MNKLLLALACLVLPFAATALDAKSTSKAPHRPTVAASAPAPAASAIDSRAAVRASKQRSTAMGACQRQAMDKNLPSDERKKFVLACLAAK